MLGHRTHWLRQRCQITIHRALAPPNNEDALRPDTNHAHAPREECGVCDRTDLPGRGVEQVRNRVVRKRFGARSTFRLSRRPLSRSSAPLSPCLP